MTELTQYPLLTCLLALPLFGALLCVLLRDESQRNQKIATGEVEVRARELYILNDARTLPFQLETVSSDALASEDLRRQATSGRRRTRLPAGATLALFHDLARPLRPEPHLSNSGIL